MVTAASSLGAGVLLAALDLLMLYRLRRLEMHKLGGDTAGTADPNCPKGYSRPYGIVRSIEPRGKLAGGPLLRNWLGIVWQSLRLHLKSSKQSSCIPAAEVRQILHEIQHDAKPIIKFFNITSTNKHEEQGRVNSIFVTRSFLEEFDFNKPVFSVLDGMLPQQCTALHAEHDAIWSGIALWSVGVSCPSRVPSQLLVPPSPLAGGVGLILELVFLKDPEALVFQRPQIQAEQPQLPQPLLIRLVLQTLHQLRCPSLDTLQPLNVSLVVRSPKLNTAFEVRPHQCRVQGHDRFPSPAGHTVSDTSQDAIGFLGHLGTLLAHVQPAVNQHPQVLLCWAAFQPLFPRPVALHGVVVTQVQDLALGLVKPHTIGLGPLIQPVQSRLRPIQYNDMMQGRTALLLLSSRQKAVDSRQEGVDPQTQLPRNLRWIQHVKAQRAPLSISAAGLTPARRSATDRLQDGDWPGTLYGGTIGESDLHSLFAFPFHKLSSLCIILVAVFDTIFLLEVSDMICSNTFRIQYVSLCFTI
ncbi:hypothetical protein QYF61_004440 [Mycteria americana]|uniref:Uncharacterized protein n=1 Tax=Mycteria americana TaxID=33587 RepID=A0AAN7RWD4_MYCAM|nr:hypothetical protein QYF61_004440 [Mycteria americana]